MSERYIGIKIVARLDAATFEEREALEQRIIAVLGCDNTEADCPMIMYGSTVYDDLDTVFAWLD